MIVIPDEVDQELRRAAAAERVGQLRGIGQILPELFAQYAIDLDRVTGLQASEAPAISTVG